ncbi:hypothetical protein VTH06DRAFT_231 [Thermothelomyces fergusii]
MIYLLSEVLGFCFFTLFGFLLWSFLSAVYFPIRYTRLCLCSNTVYCDVEWLICLKRNGKPTDRSDDEEVYWIILYSRQFPVMLLHLTTCSELG